jgi:hypothetical protein
MSDALREQQLAFAAHLRDPANNAAPEGIEDRRLKIYCDLFFNSIHGLLSSNFPVIRKTLGDEAWRTLVREFYANHRTRTPLFTEIGREFAEWLAPRGGWLPQLAHYEYAELALAIADAELPPHDPSGDLLDGIPVASPYAWPLGYDWPVHRIGPDFQPEHRETTQLLLHRDAAGDVHFSTLSPVTFALLEMIDANTTESGRSLLRMLAMEAQAPDPAAFLDDGQALLRDLHTKGVLLGTVPRC